VRLTSCLLLVGAVLLGWSLPAQAHTALVSSDPADGSRLDAAPAQIVLTFTEAIGTQGSEVALLLDDELVDTAVSYDGTRVTVTPAGQTWGPGAYTVNYRVVSADGHPVTGSSSFEVAGDTQPTSSATTQPAPVQQTPEAAADDTEDDSVWSSPLLLGAVAVLAVAAAALVLRGGRRRPDDDDRT